MSNQRLISMKSFFSYNIDLLKHLCVVANVENVGIIRVLPFLNPKR